MCRIGEVCLAGCPSAFAPAAAHQGLTHPIPNRGVSFPSRSLTFASLHQQDRFVTSSASASASASASSSTQLAALGLAQSIPAAKNAVKNVVVAGATAISSRLPRSSGFFAGFLIAVLLGFFMGRLTGQRSGAQRVSNVPLEPGANLVDASSTPGSDDEEEGVTPLWLNYAGARMWSLFQKNTKRLVSDVIQPVLDETEKPSFVTDVRVTRFVPGKRSPYIRSIRRLPSRAMNEAQYSFQTLFASTSEIDFEVDVIPYKNITLTIPVTLRNLDFDALWWSALTLAPYEPYLTGVQYALLKNPGVSFDMTVYRVIPITAVPVLRSFFFRVITKEVPKEFLFPNSVYLDFRPPEIIKSSKISKEDEARKNLKDLDKEQLMELFPEQWALFDALDLDGGGSLTPEEVSIGLKQWGYTAEDATKSFSKLDINEDGLIHFEEFVAIWPQLEDSFIPNRYKGILAVFLKKASDLPVPFIGPSDPMVTLKLGDQEAVSKRDSRTSMNGASGEPVWNEAFELNCISPRNQELEVIVQEGASIGLRRRGTVIGRATVSLSSLALLKQKQQKVTVDLEPQGTIRFNVAYADFVDQKS